MIFFLGPCRGVGAGGRASAMQPKTAGSSCSCTCRAARPLQRMRPAAQPYSATCCAPQPQACWTGCCNTRSSLPSPPLCTRTSTRFAHAPVRSAVQLLSPLPCAHTYKHMLRPCIMASTVQLLSPIDVLYAFVMCRMWTTKKTIHQAACQARSQVVSLLCPCPLRTGRPCWPEHHLTLPLLSRLLLTASTTPQTHRYALQWP